MILSKLNQFAERNLRHKGYKVPVIVERPKIQSSECQNEQRSSEKGQLEKKQSLFQSQHRFEHPDDLQYLTQSTSDSRQAEEESNYSSRSANRSKSRIKRLISKVTSLFTRITPRKTSGSALEVFDGDCTPDKCTIDDNDTQSALSISKKFSSERELKCNQFQSYRYYPFKLESSSGKQDKLRTFDSQNKTDKSGSQLSSTQRQPIHRKVKPFLINTDDELSTTERKSFLESDNRKQVDLLTRRQLRTIFCTTQSPNSDP